MAFVQFTRPDDSPVSVNTAEILKFAPVPAGGPTAGPLKQGTRIYFKNAEHQDVKELQAEVQKRLDAAH